MTTTDVDATRAPEATLKPLNYRAGARPGGAPTRVGTRSHRQKTQPRCTPIRWARKEKWCLKYEGASSTPRKPQVTKKHTRPALVTKGLALWWTSAKPYHAHPPSRTRQREDHLILTKHHTISALGHTMSTCEGDGQRCTGCCSRRIWISLLAFITRYLGKGLYIKTCIIKSEDRACRPCIPIGGNVGSGGHRARRGARRSIIQ